MGHWERGISFNDKHSWEDFHAVIESYSYTVPAKRVAAVDDVPFEAGFLNYTEQDGTTYYVSRKVTIKFYVPFEEYQGKPHHFAAWLESANNSEITDEITGTTYIGSCLSTPEVEMYRYWDKIFFTVTFLAQPWIGF